MSNNDDQFDDGLENFDEVAVDEFGNDVDPADESFAEEDWDSYDEPDDDLADDQPQAQPRKKSGNFNKIVIGLAVLCGVGVLVFQLSQGPAPVAVAVAVAPTPAPVTNVAPANDPNAQPTGGFLTSPENMAALEQDIAKTYSTTEISDTVAPADDAVAPPMPSPMTQEEAPVLTPSVPTPTATPTPPPPVATPATPPTSEPTGMDELSEAAPAPAVPDTDPVPAMQNAEPEAAIRMPSASDVLLKQPAETTTAPDQTVPDQTMAAVAPVIPPPEQSSALIDKIDLVLARLDQLEGEVKLLKEQANDGSSAEIDDLKVMLTALEKKIEAPPISPAKPSSSAEASASPSTPKPQILGSSAPKAPKPATATPQRVSTHWVLKGAQPGRAMVSQPGESEMRTIEIGDTLPGIGKITGISYQDGRWLVQGTQGRITQ